MREDWHFTDMARTFPKLFTCKGRMDTLNLPWLKKCNSRVRLDKNELNVIYFIYWAIYNEIKC